MSATDPAEAQLLGNADSLSRSQKSLLIAGAVVRTILSAVIIWVGLSLIPSDPGDESWMPVGFIVGAVVVYLFFFSYQLRKIKRARFPQIRSIEVLIVVSIMFIAVFAAIYTQVSMRSPGSFSEDLDHFTAYYYAMTVLATVGFGDITPVSPLARILSMIQMGLDLAFIGVAVKVISATAKQTMEERRSKRANKTVAQDAAHGDHGDQKDGQSPK
jgi:voltage-gated potassium channel